jgi:predicted AAA+ superfamily ATPase
MTGAVIKFPIGRVVREHRIGQILAGTAEGEAIEQAARSVRHAIKTLRRQEASLNLRAAREREKETPEQQARFVEKSMRHIYARQDEDRAAEAKPLDPFMVEVLRKLVTEADAAAEGDNNDGGSAA